MGTTFEAQALTPTILLLCRRAANHNCVLAPVPLFPPCALQLVALCTMSDTDEDATNEVVDLVEASYASFKNRVLTSVCESFRSV